MLVNDLKAGARVVLANGWVADIVDNRKGSTRMARVYGFVTEIGSVYSKDIQSVQVDGRWVPVTLSPAQAKQAAKITATEKAFFG